MPHFRAHYYQRHHAKQHANISEADSNRQKLAT